MPDITISVGESKRATRWVPKTVSWERLCKKLSTPIVTSETAAEYAAMSKDQRGNIKDVGGYVGGRIDGGVRRAGNITDRQLICLDADFASLGELSIASVTNLVDVPYDKQVQVLRNMGLTTDSLSQPHFITSEKAEEDMAAFRDEVNSEVSGTTTAPTGQVDGEESVQVSDDDVTPSGDAG